MTDLNLTELRKVAEAAAELTPGAWEVGDRWVFTLPVYDDDRRLSNIFGMNYADPGREDAEGERAQRNVEHAATFDPPTVLALLGRVAELEAALDRLHSWGGLMELLDGHWPEDVFGAKDPREDRRDPGPRIVSLLNWLDREKAKAAELEAVVARVEALANEWSLAVSHSHDDDWYATRIRAALAGESNE